jgi:hypothetical protein
MVQFYSSAERVFRLQRIRTEIMKPNAVRFTFAVASVLFIFS